MKKVFKWVTVALAVLSLLFLAGCSSQPGDGSSPSPSAATTTTPGNGSTEVETNDDTVVEVPWANARVDDGDTRSSEAMPAISGLLPNCGILQTWGDLVACVEEHNADWYKSGVDAYASTLGFTWADIEQWAAARTNNGKVAEARVVFLSGDKTSLTDDEANAAVAALTGGKILKVVRLEAPAFMNMWRVSDGMQAFADYGSQVRVSLTPLVLDKQGQVIGLDEARQFAGVFVDCDNPHGLWRRVPASPGGKLPSATAQPVQPTSGWTEPAKPAQPNEPTEPTEPTEPPAAGKGTANPDGQNGYWGEADPSQAEAQAPAGPAASADGGDWTYVQPADPTITQGSSNDKAQAGGATADSGATAGGGDKATTTDGDNAGGSGQGGDVDPDD